VLGAYKPWRLLPLRKGVTAGREEAGRGGAVVREQFRNEVQEPWVLLIAAKGGKPHQPVEPVVVRRDRAGHAVDSSGFALELVLKPFRAIRSLQSVDKMRDDECMSWVPGSQAVCSLSW